MRSVQKNRVRTNMVHMVVNVLNLISKIKTNGKNICLFRYSYEKNRSTADFLTLCGFFTITAGNFNLKKNNNYIIKQYFLRFFKIRSLILEL